MNNQDTDKHTVILDRCGDLAFRFGPVARATKDASEEQRQAVRSALEAFFRSQDGPRDRAARRDMDRQGAGLIYSAKGLQQH